MVSGGVPAASSGRGHHRESREASTALRESARVPVRRFARRRACLVSAFLRAARAAGPHLVVNGVLQRVLTVEQSLLEGVGSMEALRLEGPRLNVPRHDGS
jgi:hypothetical protein